MRRGRRTRSHQRIREGSSMGQKTVRFSDLSGQLIMHDDALARIVVHEHPELGDGPVEIEALTEEAEAMEEAALRVAVIDLYLPDDIEPRRIVMEADAFDKLATQNSMDELLTAARPVRRSTRVIGQRQLTRGPPRLRDPRARGQAAQGQDHRHREATGPRPSRRDQRAADRPGPADDQPDRPGARRALRPAGARPGAQHRARVRTRRRRGRVIETAGRPPKRDRASTDDRWTPPRSRSGRVTRAVQPSLRRRQPRSQRSMKP